MMKCNNCELIFDEPCTQHVCVEEFYGVEDMFDNLTYEDIKVCPRCGDTYIINLDDEGDDD